MATRLAVFGDVHGAFDRAAALAVDRMGYDGVLFVGDLGTMLPGSQRRVARAIGTLHTPTVVLPGNHDGPSSMGILREAIAHGWHPPGSARRVVRRTERVARWLGEVPLGGYSAHPMGDLTVIAARPWAMDGRRATFAGALERRHGLRDLAGSAERLCSLVDATSGPLVFLCHNGPAGLGARPEDPWSQGGRDAGDSDLAAAVRHAGDRAVAVVGGHMHLGRHRSTFRHHGGALHINAARVPRLGQHVEVVVAGLDAQVRWVPDAT